MKTIITTLTAGAALSLCTSLYADIDMDCVQKAATQMGPHMYGGVLNIATASPWEPKYNRATISLDTDRSYLAFSCHSKDCVDGHYGNMLHVSSCAIEPDASPSGHYEVQLSGGAFSAALQVPVDGKPPVSRIKIDASTSLAVTPNNDSNTDFEPVT